MKRLACLWFLVWLACIYGVLELINTEHFDEHIQSGWNGVLPLPGHDPAWSSLVFYLCALPATFLAVVTFLVLGLTRQSPNNALQRTGIGGGAASDHRA